MSDPIIHKLILGGGQYLPFALKKLEQLGELAVICGGYADKCFAMGDATVTLKVAGDHRFLTIEGAAPRYEFLTSTHITLSTALMIEDPRTNALASPGAVGPAPRFDPHVYGSMTRLERNGKVTPVTSGELTPAPSGPTWTVTPKIHNVTEDEGIISWGAWQDQRFTEFCNWPGNTGASMVTSTQAMGSGVNSQCGYRGASSADAIYVGQYGLTEGSGGAAKIMSLNYMSSDLGLDTEPVFYDKNGSKAGGPGYDSESVFWRRAAVQTTASGAAFVICTDNIGRFQVYRVKAYQNDTGAGRWGEPYYRSLTEDTYKMFAPPYPAWVTLPDEFWPINGNKMDYDAQSQQWLWDFDASARRAVSCPFNSVAGTFFKHKGSGKRDVVVPELFAPDLLAPDNYRRSRDDTPGLVEFGIVITETGIGPLDFDVEFTLLRNSYFADTGRFIFNAAYALPGIKGVKHGDLLTAELDVLASSYDPGPVAVRKRAFYPGEPAEAMSDPIYRHNVKFADISCTLNVNTAGMVKTPLKTIPARTALSFRYVDRSVWDTFSYTPSVAGQPPQFGYRYPIYLYAGINVATGLSSELLTRSAENRVRTVLSVGDVPVEYDLRRPGRTMNPETDQQYDDWLGRSADMAPYTESHILSLELRTLSCCVWTQDGTALRDEVVLTAYNKEVKRRTVPLSPNGDAYFLDGATAPSVELPNEVKLKLFLSMMPGFMMTTTAQGFSVSPTQHWSHSLSISPYKGDVEKFDIVSVKGRATTSHKALFNKAFGQSRNHSFYAENYPEKRDNDHDFGSFRSNGIWITF